MLVRYPCLSTSNTRKKYAKLAGWFLSLHARTKSRNAVKSISDAICFRRRSNDCATNGSAAAALARVDCALYALAAAGPFNECSSYRRFTNTSVKPCALHASAMRTSNVYRLNSALDRVPFMSRSKSRKDLYTRCADASENQFLSRLGSSSLAACSSLKSASASPESRFDIRAFPRRLGSSKNMNRRVAIREYCFMKPAVSDCSAAIVVTDLPTNASSSSSVSHPSASASWHPKLIRDCVSATCLTTNSMNVRPFILPSPSLSKRLNVRGEK
mmetsp:Transcript_7656/g.27930  ORF Transcript_7656/g.27930 Transcript_7656/m.27930 type:complete len:272 (+) Transcript_7656:359-1174(+)